MSNPRAHSDSTAGNSAIREPGPEPQAVQTGPDMPFSSEVTASSPPAKETDDGERHRHSFFD